MNEVGRAFLFADKDESVVQSFNKIFVSKRNGSLAQTDEVFSVIDVAVIRTHGSIEGESARLYRHDVARLETRCGKFILRNVKRAVSVFVDRRNRRLNARAGGFCGNFFFTVAQLAAKNDAIKSNAIVITRTCFSSLCLRISIIPQKTSFEHGREIFKTLNREVSVYDPLRKNKCVQHEMNFL